MAKTPEGEVLAEPHTEPRTKRKLALKIEYVPRTHETCVIPFIIDAYTSLRRAGNIEAFDCPASGEEEAFYITNRKKKVVAVLSFFASSEKSFTVNMGFVLKAYRKKGHYAALWSRLVEEAQERGMTTIIGYHKPGNSAILAFNEKVGRKMKYICSHYPITHGDSN